MGCVGQRIPTGKTCHPEQRNPLRFESDFCVEGALWDDACEGIGMFRLLRRSLRERLSRST